jgi:two-component system, OmpR family, sensor histidine kinase SenX3
VDWAVAAGVAGGTAVGLLAAVTAVLLIVRARRRRPTDRQVSRPITAGVRDGGRPGIGKDPQQDPLAGLGRKSLDSLRVGVVVLDRDDVPVLVNPAARAMGLLRPGATSGTVSAHPIVRTLAGQVRHTGVRREVELALPRGQNGGTQEPLGVHLRAVGLGGDFVAVEAADVTEAHRVSRVRRDFVANISHELKTPIGALQLLAEALLDATDTTTANAAPDDVAAARRFAERIRHESNRLGRLVNELIELSRLQGAEPLPAPEPVAVDWAVAEVVDRTRTAAAARLVEVVVEGRRGLTVYGNDNQIATALANLVENAIAYSAEGSRVRITTGRNQDYVELAVADQGIGIAPHEVDRIFERFYRADQARSRATGGTGLGLAIVKHIATNHGGRVDVASTLGGGSTFTLRLPARPPAAVPPLPASAEIDSAPAELRQV